MPKSPAERQRVCRANRKAKAAELKTKHAPLRVIAERVYKFLVEFPEQAEKVDRSMRQFSQEIRAQARQQSA